MVDVRPFRGLRYNPSLAGDLTNLVCPPYDVISPEQQAQLYKKSQYNAVRLELSEARSTDNEKDNRYTRTAATLRQWLQQNVIVPERSPAMYLVEESYRLRGAVKTRRTILASVRLEEFGKGSIFPHEYTTEGPKQDRLELMKACSTNFSPIMGLFSDPGGVVQGLVKKAASGSPDAVTELIDGGLAYNVWVISDSSVLASVRRAFGSVPVYIADGHHRYETALMYRALLKQQGKLTSENAAANFVMMGLISLEDPGLLVMPYHRLLNGLSEGEISALWERIEEMFELERQKFLPPSPMATAEALAVRLSEIANDRIALAVYTNLRPEKALVLILKDSYMPGQSSHPLERCDTYFLSHQVLKPALGESRARECLSFVHDGSEAVQRSKRGESQMAFLLRSISMDLFQKVVSKGDRLPSKSTYFYPKLPTGLVFNPLVGELF